MSTLLPASVLSIVLVLTPSLPITHFNQNGSLVGLTDPSGTTTFTWNARNQLSGISGPSIMASFQYDALSRREVKTVNGKMPATAVAGTEGTLTH